jgi:hypothetical protein
MAASSEIFLQLPRWTVHTLSPSYQETILEKWIGPNPNHYTLSSFALAKAASASLVLPSALRATPLLFQVAATAA